MQACERIARNGRCFGCKGTVATDTLVTVPYHALCGNARTTSDINTVNYGITSLLDTLT